MKNIASAVAAVSLMLAGAAQGQVLLFEDFETSPGAYTTSVPEFTNGVTVISPGPTGATSTRQWSFPITRASIFSPPRTLTVREARRP